MNGGVLVPWLVEPVLPGDTWEVETSKVVRLQTLLHPYFGMAYLDVYYFFVPNRLVWTHWKEFCGENNSSAWIPSVTYTIPKVKITLRPNALASQIGSAPDYMGIPFGTQYVGTGSSNTSEFNALPFRAYMLCWQDFFRDENLQNPLNIPLGDATVLLDTMLPHDTSVTPNRWYACLPVAKYHDYFTSALPGVQKGPATTFNLGVSAPLSATQALVKTSSSDHVSDYGLHFQVTSGTPSYKAMDMITSGGLLEIKDTAASSQLVGGNNSNNTGTYAAPSNLIADLSGITANLAAANSISVNDLRMAFAVQRFYEALSRGGSRYTEILQNLFKVRSPDARLQRPEYLGGNRIPISVHQVVNQAESSTADLGNLGAYSISTDRHKDFIYSATEHGWILGLCCIRHTPLYAQGAERFWFDDDKFSIYWPQLANLGEQPIYNGEIYFQGNATDMQAFGFQEAWASYRYKPNRVAGELRPGVPNSLASWTLADYYTSQPYLSDAWIREDIAPLDRALAVSSSAAHQALCDFYVQAKVVRPMPLYSVPGLIDHH